MNPPQYRENTITEYYIAEKIWWEMSKRRLKITTY